MTTALYVAPMEAPQSCDVTIVPGLDHGSIYSSAEMKRQPEEMLAHLKARGHVR